jgi:quercetin dioxygenase-like cupin family protein
MTTITLLSAAETQTQETDWGCLRWKASGTLGNDAGMTVGLCEIRPGHANPRHHHPNCSEVLHVLQGTIAHTYGDQEVVMAVGDVITVPPGLVHNARNIGAETAVLAIAFNAPDRLTVGE